MAYDKTWSVKTLILLGLKFIVVIFVIDFVGSYLLTPGIIRDNRPEVRLLDNHTNKVTKPLLKNISAHKTTLNNQTVNVTNTLYKNTPKDKIKYNKTEKVVRNVVKKNITKKHNIKILYWTDSYKSFLSKATSFTGCKYSNCAITNDKMEYNSSDAVLFYLWYSKKETFNKIRQYRPPRQKWILHLRESPVRTAQNKKFQSLAKFNNLFNVTWTYHSKSDIVSNYTMGSFVYVKPTEQIKTRNNYAFGKTKLVAGFASNCHDTSGRLQYIQQLQSHINVDLYGRCGTLKCSKHDHKQCYKMLEKDYKFYLAFENSLCDEYITEKLWNVIPKYNIIPVVMGGGNYSKYLPPRSFIDIKDFNSPKELADYLLKLNNSNDLYNSYFTWKQNYKFVYRKKSDYNWPCQLCSYLNRANHISKSYERLDKFWSAKEDCKTPQEFYRNMESSVWLTNIKKNNRQKKIESTSANKKLEKDKK